jgi:hypothetical protein
VIESSPDTVRSYVATTFSCRSRGIQNRPATAPEARQKAARGEIVGWFDEKIQSASRRRAAKAEGLAHSTTLREIQLSPELAERLDCGDFSTAFVRTGKIHHSGLSARPTAPLKPAQSKRIAQFASHKQTLRVMDCGGPPPLFHCDADAFPFDTTCR